jgi:hypothetical protein
LIIRIQAYVINEAIAYLPLALSEDTTDSGNVRLLSEAVFGCPAATSLAISASDTSSNSSELSSIDISSLFA